MSRSSIFKTIGYALSGGGGALNAGLQCYYNFEGNGNDATSNARNLGGNYQQVTGKIGQYAAGFTGGNQGLYFNTDLWDVYASPQDFSVSLWFNPSQLTDGFVFGDAFSAMGLWLQLNSNGTVFSNIWSSGLANVTSTTTLNIGTWYHVTVVHNSIAKTLKLYINGVLEATGTYTGFSGLPPQYNHYRGFAVDGSALANGSEYGMACKFDAVGLWNRQLTDSEITYLYNSGNGQAYPFAGGGGGSIPARILIKGYGSGGGVPDNALLTGILTYWKFDDNGSGAVSLIDSTENGRTLVNNNGVTLGNGKINGSAFLNNSQTLTNTSSFTPTGNSPFSFSTWIKLSEDYTFMVFSYGIPGTSRAVALYVPTPLRLNFQFWDTGFGNIPITANEWHHVVGTYDGTTAKIYVDGSLSGSLVINLNTGSGSFRFNEWVNGSRGTGTCYVDEFGLWNRALASDEVTKLYAEGNALAYPFLKPVNIPPNFRIITKGYVKPTPSIVTNGLILLLDASEVSSYSGTGAVWNDISGSGNNFNINPAAFNSGGKYMDFKGSYGMAKNNANINLSGDVTYLCVTRIKNSAADWRTLTRAYPDSTGDHHVIVQAGAWNIGMFDNYSGTGFRGTGYSQQSLPGYGSNSFDVMSWRWTNADNPTYDFNVNGIQKGTISSPNSRYRIGFGALGGYSPNDGNPNNASQYWGDIKLFAVYNRRLTDEEVTKNYNALVAKFGL